MPKTAVQEIVTDVLPELPLCFWAPYAAEVRDMLCEIIQGKNSKISEDSLIGILSFFKGVMDQIKTPLLVGINWDSYCIALSILQEKSESLRRVTDRSVLEADVIKIYNFYSDLVLEAVTTDVTAPDTETPKLKDGEEELMYSLIFFLNRLAQKRVRHKVN